MALMTERRTDHALADLLVENLRVALAIVREGTPLEARSAIMDGTTRAARAPGLRRLEAAMRSNR